MKPNISKITIIDLPQNVFFTWLLQWADEECAQYDTALHAVAQNFVRLLLDKGPEYPIKKVIAQRKFAAIDIWVEVNEQYFIAILDGITLHPYGLESSKEIAEAHCRAKQWSAPKLICLNTENTSLREVNGVRTKGYKVIFRKEMLEILSKNNVINSIFRHFVDSWIAIEDQTNSFHKFENIRCNKYSIQGLFLELQNRIEGSDWQYSPSYEIARFRVHRQELPKSDKFHVQIDGHLKDNIELCIAMSIRVSTFDLQQIFSEMLPLAEKYGLTICKPEEFETPLLLATVNEAFRETEDGDFDFEHLMKTLKNLEKTIEAYCQSKED